MSEKITSKKILTLLSYRHFDDVFVSECKDGPTWGASHFRLDAWAMKRSWANAGTFGYEIKVSRSDFINDHKWRNYLPLCEQFYFVCPHGIIRPDELPPEAGLMVAAKTGTRVYIKKKAPHRGITIPENLLRYILLSRSKIVEMDLIEERGRGKTCKKSYWNKWLKEKKLTHDIGRKVSKALSKRLDEEVFDAQDDNNRLRRKMERLQEVADFLKDIDVDPSTWGRDEKIKKALACIPNSMDMDLQRMITNLAELKSDFKKLGHGLQK